MKRKDIKNQLKRETKGFVPDPLDKIKRAAREENLLPDDSRRNSETYSQGNTAVMAKVKRKAVWSFAAVTSLVVCFTFIWSFVFKPDKNKPLEPANITLSANDVYGMGAVSSVKLLGSSMPASAVQTFSALQVTARSASDFTADTSEEEVKQEAERFNEYFTALDSFLGEDVISTTTEVNTDATYAYDTKMTINGKDFNGESVTYVMYYTETLVEEDSDKNDKKTESEYELVGVMVIDGVDYYLEGERLEETKKDESETELKIRAYADMTDKKSYVQMEQESSVESGETETEYVYSIYANGKLVEQTAVEFETERKNNKVETEYELEFRNGTSKGKYVVEREVKEGKTTMKVKYKIDGKEGEFRIREITNEKGDKNYEYTFSDNETIVF